MTAEAHALRVVLMAAGRGSRFGGAVPKQFESLGGIPVALHSARVLAAPDGVTEMILVLPEGGWPEDCAAAREAFAAPLAVPVRTVEGGPRRQDSVARGIVACGTDPSQVILVHDAARPFPPRESVIELVRIVRGRAASDPAFGGGLLAIPSTDSVKRVGECGKVKESLRREEIWLAQTPQAVVGAHAPSLCELLQGPGEFTDETAALESLGLHCVAVQGSPDNFKITHPADLERARQVLARGA